MYSPGLAVAGIGALLSFIAFIAAIVVTVLLYKKFISTGNQERIPGMKRDWGPFLRFESLMIEKILQVLYLFTASLIAFECAAAMISSLFSIMYEPGGALMGILLAAVLCVVLEVLNRIGFEFALMTVLIWKNTSVIRKTLEGNPSAAVPGNAAGPVGGAPMSGASPASPQPQAVASTPTAPTQPAAAQPEEPVQAEVPSEGWVCPQCGASNGPGQFCGQCGQHR